MSKSTKGLRKAGLASIAVTLTLGASLAGAGSASAVADFKFDRIGGADRYDTAAQVADAYGTFTEAILANGEPGNYADALTANYLSGVKKAPILLTRKDSTPKFTLDELKESGVKTITIVGGVGVVSAEQEASLKSAGYTVNRVSGTDRFQTNAQVIKAGGNAKALGVIATGFNFADALGAGPAAYNGHALGLSEADDIDDDVVAALKAAGVTRVLVLGGPTIVSDKVVAELKAAGIELEKRIFGADRSETSTDLADYEIANLGFTNTAANVASGYVEGYGADALAGGPLTGKQLRPLLITRDVNNVGDLDDWMKEHADTLREGTIFGGTGAVSAAAQDTLEKAAQTAPASATTRPELVSAAIVDTNTAGELGTDGTTVRFTFDEALATATTGTAPDETLFYVYNSTTAGALDAGDAVTELSGNSVTVRFDGVVTDAAAAALTVATVDFGAVFDDSDAANPEGDAALNQTTGGGSTPLPAGITTGPDLTSIGGFAAVAGGGTDVEFVFDEAADVAAGTAFDLIGTDGTVVTGDTVTGGSGTKNVIIRFSETLNRADIARGIANAGAATEDVDNESDGTDANVMQAADVSNSGNSGDPDLVSVELREATATIDQVLYTFDESIASADGTQFSLYKTNGDTVSGNGTEAINSSNTRQVLVDFAEGAIDNAVGAQVAAVAATPAVTGTDTNTNEQDEVGVANTGSTAGQTAGRTDGPDLTKVSVAQSKDGFGNVIGATATYTFDEAVEGAAANAGDFRVYLANGTRLVADTCAVNDNSTATTDDDVSVTCSFLGDTPVDAAATAVIGTVDDAAVNEAGAGTLTNPEGAERVS